MSRHLLPLGDEAGNPFDPAYACGPFRGIHSLRRITTLKARLARRALRLVSRPFPSL